MLLLSKLAWASEFIIFLHGWEDGESHNCCIHAYHDKSSMMALFQSH